jgi:hypothetical protein
MEDGNPGREKFAPAAKIFPDGGADKGGTEKI